MGPGQQNLIEGAAFFTLFLTHFDDIDLDAVALADQLARYHFAHGQHHLVTSDHKYGGLVLQVDTLYNPGHNFALLIRELAGERAVDRLVDSLHNDVLSDFGGDSAEALCVQVNFGNVADDVFFIYFFCRGEVDFRQRVFHVFHDLFAHEEPDRLLFLVKEGGDILRLHIHILFLFDRGDDGCRDLLQHIFLFDVLFFFQKGQRLIELAIHILSSCRSV